MIRAIFVRVANWLIWRVAFLPQADGMLDWLDNYAVKHDLFSVFADTGPPLTRLFAAVEPFMGEGGWTEERWEALMDAMFEIAEIRAGRWPWDCDP